VLASTATAFIMLLVVESGTDKSLDEFMSVLPFDGTVWTFLLVLAGLTTAIGMAAGWQSAVGVGSMSSFMLWVFGAISFASTGNAGLVIVLIAPIMIFFAYLFLGVAFRDRPQA
jgi:hypothetical protein